MYFISDLHLHESRPNITEGFFNFLDKMACHYDKLFILGDFFEYWISYDCASEHDKNVLGKLLEFTSKGKKIFFLPGNRDFLIDEKTLNKFGCELLKDPYIINLNGKKIILTHGDLLCTDDKKYQKYRKVVHNKFLQKIFSWLPNFIKRKIAKALRKGSKNTNKIYIDVNEEEVKKWLEKYSAEILLHGHTHKPNIYKYDDKCRIVLSDWNDFGATVANFKNTLELQLINN